VNAKQIIACQPKSSVRSLGMEFTITVNFSTYVVVSMMCLLQSCTTQSEKPVGIESNKELKQLVVKDQELRESESGEPMELLDKVHRKRVLELLVNGDVRTAQDKFNAALILQHTALTYCNDRLISMSPENYLLAHTLARSAFASGYKEAAYLTAATYDRYLLFTEGFQKYGTQNSMAIGQMKCCGRRLTLQ